MSYYNDDSRYGFEDLTKIDQYADDRPVDTSSFKDAGVNEHFWQQGEEAGKGATYEEVQSPIRKLKEIILDLDWEITDDNVQRFFDTAGELQEEWQADKVVQTLLNVLMSLAKYIGSQKARAHADAINLLFSVYNSLEKIVLSDGMENREKEKLLNVELVKFEEMKRAIAKAKAEDLKARMEKQLEESEPDSPKAVILPLKVLVLSIDWEISEELMEKYTTEISKLENKWRDDKARLLLLKLLRSIGEHVNKRKAHSHPGSLKLLFSVYNSLEQIVLTDDLSDSKKNELAAKALRKFQKLKSEIARMRHEEPAVSRLPAEAAPPAEKEEPGVTVSFEPKPEEEAAIRVEEAGTQEAGEPSIAVPGEERPAGPEAAAPEVPPAAVPEPPAEKGAGEGEADLESRLDQMFPGEEEEGISLTMEEGEALPAGEAGGPPAALSAETEPGAGETVAPEVPPAAVPDVETTKEAAPERPESTEEEHAPAAAAPEAAPEVTALLEKLSGRFAQFQADSGRIREKIELLFQLQLLQTTVVLSQFSSDVADTETRELLRALLADIRLLANEHERLSSGMVGRIRQIIDRFMAEAGGAGIDSSSPGGAASVEAPGSSLDSSPADEQSGIRPAGDGGEADDS